MSETKISYGVAQHIENADKRQQQEWADFRAAEQAARQARLGGNTILGPGETMEMIQATGLPALLAGMVNEFSGALTKNDFNREMMTQNFALALIRSTEPLLTEYLSKLANPPQFVVKVRE